MTPAFSIRTFTIADLPGLVAVQHSSQPLHPWTVEELARDLERLEPRLQHHFLVAESGGRVIGLADFLRPAGSYDAHRFQLHLGVLPDCRRQGVGRALHAAVWKELAPLEPTAVSVQVRESDPESVRFAEARGYVELKRDFESILDLAAFDFAAFAAHMDPEGVRFGSFRELDSPEFRRRFHQVFETVRVDIPRSDPPTPLTFEFFQENVLEEPDMVPEAFVFALEGEAIVGFTGGYRCAEDKMLDTWLTAVLRRCRGRGLALALKLRSLEQVRELGFRRAKTDNDTRNLPMLKVNDRLGFQRQPALISMRKVCEVS